MIKIYSKPLFGLSFIPLGLSMLILMIIPSNDYGLDNMGWVIPGVTWGAFLIMSLSKPDDKPNLREEKQ